MHVEAGWRDRPDLKTMKVDARAIQMRCKDKLASILASATMPDYDWDERAARKGDWYAREDRQAWWEECSRRTRNIRIVLRDLVKE